MKTVLVLLLVQSVLISALVPLNTNLIGNPGCENGNSEITTWNGKNSDLTCVDSDGSVAPTSGSYFYAFAVAEDGLISEYVDVTFLSDDFEHATGIVFTFTAQVQTSAPTSTGEGVKVKITLTCAGVDDTILADEVISPATYSDWTLVDSSISCPDTTDHITIAVDFLVNDQESGVVYMDDLYLGLNYEPTISSVNGLNRYYPTDASNNVLDIYLPSPVPISLTYNVTLGGAPLDCVVASTTRLTITIIEGSGSRELEIISVDMNQVLFAQNLTYQAPQIHGGNYHHRDVNITGINFGPVGTPVTVLIGGVEALTCDVIIDHTEIYCEVEKSVATASVSLSVTADGVGPATYSIFPPMPTVTGLSSVTAGSVTTITGDNMGDYADKIKVSIGGKDCPIVGEANITTAYCTVPAGTGTRVNTVIQFVDGFSAISSFDYAVAQTSGDPHFYGFKNQKYDVMGQSYEIYNIISAPYLQINSQFIPYYKTATQLAPTGTMMGSIGIKIFNERILIAANSTIAWLNDVPVDFTQDWSVELENGVKMSSVAKKRMYDFSLETEDVIVTFIRRVYNVKGLEPQWHYDYKAALKKGSVNFHGLLGQTYEYKMFENKEGAFKYLDGAEDDYRILSNNIFGDEFKYNLFQNN